MTMIKLLILKQENERSGIRSRIKYIIGILAVLIFLLSAMPQEAHAAAKISVSDMSTTSYLRVKESRQINAVIAGAAGTYSAFRFKSSDPSVASVSEQGVVKGKKSGRTTVTISTKEKVKKGSKTTTRTIKKKLKIRVTKYRHVSHRGLQNKAPANSKKAYQLAGKAHFWGMEADIQESMPDENGQIQLYVCHDVNLQLFCGVDRKLADMTPAEIDSLRIIDGTNAEKYNQKICTLAGFLDVCKKYGAVPYLDTKIDFSDQAVQMIADMLAERGQLKKCRLVGYCDTSMRAIQEYAYNTYGAAPSIILNVNVKTNPDGRTAIQQVKYARSMGYQGVSVNKNAMNKKIDTYCKEKKLELNLWSYKESEKSRLMDQLKTFKSVYTDMDDMLVE